MILVAARGEHATALGYHLKPLGFTLEHYTDPVQVIERLDEIDPQAILFNAGDFPRHWKTLLQLAREKKPREDLIFLLIAPKDFEMEDAAKAAHLGVNGILKPEPRGQAGALPAGGDHPPLPLGAGQEELHAPGAPAAGRAGIRLHASAAAGLRQRAGARDLHPGIELPPDAPLGRGGPRRGNRDQELLPEGGRPDHRR